MSTPTFTSALESVTTYPVEQSFTSTLYDGRTYLVELRVIPKGTAKSGRRWYCTVNGRLLPFQENFVKGLEAIEGLSPRVEGVLVADLATGRVDTVRQMDRVRIIVERANRQNELAAKAYVMGKITLGKYKDSILEKTLQELTKLLYHPGK